MIKPKSFEQAMEVPMTPRQNEVFLAIDEFWKRFGFGPSVDDIMRLTGAAGRGNVSRICKKLVELGVCKHVPNRARSIRPVYINLRKIQ